MDTAVRVGKGTYEYEKARVTRICNELAPGRLALFAGSRNLINFQIRDAFFEVNLTETSGDWTPGELEDMSDDDIRDLVKRLSNGKIS